VKDHRVGLCLGVTENNTPAKVTEEFQHDETLPLVLFMDKSCVHVNDHITAFLFIENNYAFDVSFTVDFETSDDYIYTNLTTIPNLMTYTSNKKTLYRGFIGIAKNSEKFCRVDFNVRSKSSATYSKPKMML
jgi:hypothetical protein